MRYHPKASCGTKSFLLQNQATANLYYYTPYTPNDAALNNLYGTGDSCSAYGNRNFWRFYHDWFGSPIGGGYLLKAEGTETFLIVDDKKYLVSDARLLAALRPLGPLGEISQAYLDSFTTVGNAGQIVKNISTEEIFLLVDGLRYRVSDCSVAQAYGQSCDLDSIRSICEPLDIPVIVDSAEALGSTHRGRSVGKGATAAVFSFNGNKVLTTSGGGILASDDGDLVNRARFLSSHAKEDEIHYEHLEIGYNYRMSNLLAAVGLGQFEVLEDRVRRKRAIFDFYRESFDDVEGIEMMPEADYGVSNRWLTVIRIDPRKFGADRNHVIEKLEVENIESRPVMKPMHLQPVFSNRRIVRGSIAEAIFKTGLCLPSGTALTEMELTRIVEVILGCRKSRP
jgi:dTDP-4-amino-4,6-dideoxygalactose transaminase